MGTYEVVDGQQRITTLQILIAAIRDRWHELGNPMKHENGMQVPHANLTTNLIHATVPVVQFTLTPNRYLKEIFLDYVQKTPDGGQKKISDRLELMTYTNFDHAHDLINAVKLLRQKVSDLDATQLQKLENYVLNNVKVLRVEAGGSANAYLLFETLNYRGLELAQSDLVKSYMYSRIEDDNSREKFISDWDEAMANIGKVAPDTFLRHFLTLRYGRTQKRHIFNTIKLRTSKHAEAIAFSKDMLKISKLYGIIIRNFDSQGMKADELDSVLDDLDALRVDTQAIFLLAAMEVYYKLDTNDSRNILISLCRLTEVLSMRWSTCGKNAQELENLFQRAAMILTKQESDALSAARHELIKAMPIDDQFKYDLENAYLKNNARASYILRKIEVELMRGGAFNLKPASKLHVEHIAPQRPAVAGGWKEALEGELSYAEVVYRIGNMTLLPKKLNLEASNKPFVEKLGIYASQEKFNLPQMTREILREPSWTQQSVARRSEMIAEKALEIWPVPLV
jgi:hypothetical protein